jgi:hypothetical protein
MIAKNPLPASSLRAGGLGQISNSAFEVGILVDHATAEGPLPAGLPASGEAGIRIWERVTPLTAWQAFLSITRAPLHDEPANKQVLTTLRRSPRKALIVFFILR